jgi:alpha/beta hydrolase fold
VVVAVRGREPSLLNTRKTSVAKIANFGTSFGNITSLDLSGGKYSALAARGGETEGVATATEHSRRRLARSRHAFTIPKGKRQRWSSPTVAAVGHGRHREPRPDCAMARGGDRSRVIQIEYRLAPEQPYSTSTNDVRPVLSATLHGSRVAPVLVAGDSAGVISPRRPYSVFRRTSGVGSRVSSRSMAPTCRR